MKKPKDFREAMSPELLEYFREQGKRGGKKSGKARMEKLTPEHRSEIAKKAGRASAAARKRASMEPVAKGN